MGDPYYSIPSRSTSVKVTKQQLFSFVALHGKIPSTDPLLKRQQYHVLEDGVAICRLLNAVFPWKSVTSIVTAQHASSIAARASRNWRRILQTLADLGVPEDIVRREYFTARTPSDSIHGYSAIAFFYFMFHLARRTDFSAEFHSDVTQALSTFLQSLDSIRALVLGGALQADRVPEEYRDYCTRPVDAGSRGRGALARPRRNVTDETQSHKQHLSSDSGIGGAFCMSDSDSDEFASTVTSESECLSITHGRGSANATNTRAAVTLAATSGGANDAPSCKAGNQSAGGLEVGQERTEENRLGSHDGGPEWLMTDEDDDPPHAARTPHSGRRCSLPQVETPTAANTAVRGLFTERTPPVELPSQMQLLRVGETPPPAAGMFCMSAGTPSNSGWLRQTRPAAAATEGGTPQRQEPEDGSEADLHAAALQRLLLTHVRDEAGRLEAQQRLWSILQSYHAAASHGSYLESQCREQRAARDVAEVARNTAEEELRKLQASVAATEAALQRETESHQATVASFREALSAQVARTEHWQAECHRAHQLVESAAVAPALGKHTPPALAGNAVAPHPHHHRKPNCERCVVLAGLCATLRDLDFISMELCSEECVSTECSSTDAGRWRVEQLLTQRDTLQDAVAKHLHALASLPEAAPESEQHPVANDEQREVNLDAAQLMVLAALEERVRSVTISRDTLLAELKHVSEDAAQWASEALELRGVRAELQTMQARAASLSAELERSEEAQRRLREQLRSAVVALDDERNTSEQLRRESSIRSVAPPTLQRCVHCAAHSAASDVRSASRQTTVPNMLVQCGTGDGTVRHLRFIDDEGSGSPASPEPNPPIADSLPAASVGHGSAPLQRVPGRFRLTSPRHLASEARAVTEARIISVSTPQTDDHALKHMMASPPLKTLVPLPVAADGADSLQMDGNVVATVD